MRSNKLGDSYFLVYTLGQEKLDSVGRQRDLDANIEKDAHHAQNRMLVAPDAAARGRGAIGAGAVRLAPRDRRQMHEHHRKAKHEQRPSDGDVRPLHSVRNRCLVGDLGVGKNKVAHHQRRQSGTKRVEGLRQRQTSRSGALRSQNRDVGIGRGLQNADARGQHKAGGQKEREADHRRRRDEQQRSDHHDEQRSHHGAFVANLLNQLAAGHREDQVG